MNGKCFRNSLGALILVLGLCSVSCAQEAAGTPRGPAPAVYENKAAGVTITCPAGWFMKEWVSEKQPPAITERSSGVIFSLQPPGQPQQNNVQMQLSCFAAPISFDLDHPLDSEHYSGVKGLLQFCNGIVNGLVNAADRTYSLTQKPALFTLNGADGIWFAYDVALKKATGQDSFTFAEYHFLYKKSWVFIMCVAGKENYKAHEKEIQSSINSLRFQ